MLLPEAETEGVLQRLCCKGTDGDYLRRVDSERARFAKELLAQGLVNTSAKPSTDVGWKLLVQCFLPKRSIKSVKMHG